MGRRELTKLECNRIMTVDIYPGDEKILEALQKGDAERAAFYMKENRIYGWLYEAVRIQSIFLLHSRYTVAKPVWDKFIALTGKHMENYPWPDEIQWLSTPEKLQWTEEQKEHASSS